MSGTIVVTQTDSPSAPGAGKGALSLPTANDQVRLVDGDSGSTHILAFPSGGGTVTLPGTGTVALRSDKLSVFATTTSAELAGVISDETGTGAAVFATSPTLVTPALGTPSALVLTNATGLPTGGLVDGAVTLAKMANLAQDQFIGRTTASTGVPQTATITAAARTVLDDATVAAMVDTLGGASSVGTGGLARATSPVFGTNISTPAIVTASGALTVTPAAGSGVAIVLATTGDFSVNTNQLYVDTSTGNVGIGTTSPAGKLHSKQSSTTAAIPALELEQLDVSEEFINFVATSAASVANPITTWTTGGAIAGHVRIGINGTFYWLPFFTAPTA